MTRIAYSILAYKEPENVARLVNRVQRESDIVRIHLDPIIGKGKFAEWKKIIEKKCQRRNIDIVSDFRCKFGSFGQVDANLSAMRAYEDYNYDYFIDLTEDSYPLKPPKVIKKELGEKNVAFMEFFELPYEGWHQGGLHRLNYRYYFINTRTYPYARFFKIPRLRQGLPGGLKPYGGRGNLCLPKRHVSYILQFVDKNPSVRRFFRRVWGPDEIFYHTILLNSPLRSSVINQSTMYFCYLDGALHPKYLTKCDLDVLKRCGKFFARKFSLKIDKDILKIIDREFISYKTPSGHSNTQPKISSILRKTKSEIHKSK